MMRGRTENKHILEIEGDEKERAEALGMFLFFLFISKCLYTSMGK